MPTFNNNMNVQAKWPFADVGYRRVHATPQIETIASSRTQFDLDYELAERSLRALMQRAYEGRMLVFGYHFCFPCLGHVTPTADGWQWQPGELEMAA